MPTFELGKFRQKSQFNNEESMIDSRSPFLPCYPHVILRKYCVVLSVALCHLSRLKLTWNAKNLRAWRKLALLCVGIVLRSARWAALHT